MNRPPARLESGYSDVDGSADPHTYVRRLDAVGVSDFWQRLKQRTYALLELQPGDDVLDVGCGTGEDVRALARIVGPAGCAVGVDSSETMIAEARQRSKGQAGATLFLRGDAAHLDLESSRFNGCRAERLLQHVDDPSAVIAEMARVTRPGGRLILVEPDHGTLAIAGADRSVTRRIVAARVSHFRSGRVGSDLPRLVSQAGLRLCQLMLLTQQSTDYASDRRSGVLEKYADGAWAAGAITRSERDGWLSALQAAADLGAYRHSLTVFVLGGQKL